MQEVRSLRVWFLAVDDSSVEVTEVGCRSNARESGDETSVEEGEVDEEAVEERKKSQRRLSLSRARKGILTPRERFEVPVKVDEGQKKIEAEMSSGELTRRASYGHQYLETISV